MLDKCCDHIKGGPVELLVRGAHNVRSSNWAANVLAPRLSYLMKHACEATKQYAQIDSQEDPLLNFRRAYNVCRLTALCCPGAYEENRKTLMDIAARFRDDSPLIARMVSRAEALTGNPDSIERQRDFWLANYEAAPERQLVAVGYCAAYFSPLRIGRSLLTDLHTGALTSLRHTISANKSLLQKVIVAEAFENTREAWYLRPEWAQINFLRMHLVMRYMGGYSSLSTDVIRKSLDVVALAHSRSLGGTTAAKTVRRMSQGVITSLKGILRS